MTCHDVEERDLVAEYAHGRLTGPDRDAFEAHFLDCEACFEAIQTYRLLHGLLAPQALPLRASWRRTSIWVGLAAAAGLALAIATTLRSGDPLAPRSPDAFRAAAPQAPPQPPAANTASAPSPTSQRAERIQQLARFDPPRYEPPALRGADDDARRRFQAAMALYRAGNYNGAAGALRAELQAGVSTAEVRFYLAISDLQSGRRAEAAAGLEQVLAANDVLFEEDAHFFLGKLWLAQGDVARARGEFSAVVALNGDRVAAARELVSALDTLITR